MEILFIISAFIITVLVSLLTRRRGVIEFFSIFASAISLYESVVVALKVSASGIYSSSAFFSVDSLGAIIMLIIGFIGFAITVYSVQYLRRETAKDIVGFTRVKQYFILLNLFLVAMFLAVSVSSPIFAWIFIEATTLSTAFLISFYNKPSSIEAAWKYLIINSVGLLLGFFGTLLFFTSVSSSGENGLVSWQMLSANAAHLDPLLVKIAFIFVLIGYGTKVGLVPMHTWLPDAHAKAPAPISALLSGVLLNVALLIVLRFKVITDASIGNIFSQNLLIIFGFLSIIIASFINFTQKSYKRLLAYSSIENMGISALGFGFGGLGIFAAILHIIYHALTKSALFLSAGTIYLKYSSTKIAKVRGMLIAIPVTSILFIFGFFIITGAPPFGMFFTKLLIFSAGIAAHPIITIASLFSAVILFISFFHRATTMFFGEKPSDIKDGEESIWLMISPIVLLTIVFCLSFYLPPFLHKLINDAVLHY